jgi:release factor glutamine methyltransferase
MVERGLGEVGARTVADALRLATEALVKRPARSGSPLSAAETQGVAGDERAGRVDRNGEAMRANRDDEAVDAHRNGKAMRTNRDDEAVDSHRNGKTVHAHRNEEVSDAYRNDDAHLTARNEAEWLWQWVTGWSRTTLLLSLQEVVTGGVWSDFGIAISRRVNGEPLQYITRQAPFYGRWFHVEPGCLIPRPETELLAEAAISYIKACLQPRQQAQPDGMTSVVDIGTGSGALAVTIALECPDCAVDAIDLSPDALRIAQGNADKLGAQVSFVQMDGVEWLRTQRQLIHVLVSNPPYIPSADIDELDTDVREHEPRLALDGGADGLDFYRRLASLGAGIFADGPAALFLEVGAGQAEDVKSLFTSTEVPQTSEAPQTSAESLSSEAPQVSAASEALQVSPASFSDWSFEILKDLQGIDRIVKGVRINRTL